MDVKTGRYTANYPDEFVVFFIGMRINQLWRVNELVSRGARRVRDE